MSITTISRARYSHCIGFFAETGRGFSNPYDVAPGADGTLYVINRSNGADAPLGGLRVAVVKLSSEYLGEWGAYGEGPGQLVWPASIQLDRQGRLWLADEHRHDVQAFETDGAFVSRIGGLGSEAGRFNRPSGLAFDADGNLVVADTYNHRLQKLSPDGQVLAVWGGEGAEPGRFNLPWGMTVDGEGRIYVADWRNDRVQQLEPDGRPRAVFGVDGPAEARLKRPAGVAVDRVGRVYVADWGNNLVKIFGPSGELVQTLSGEADLSVWAREYLAADTGVAAEREQAASLEAEKRFWGPTGLKLDAAGRLYVVESCRHRMQIYETA
jgi:DNA-binding beta-propeller fold protein YncE